MGNLLTPIIAIFTSVTCSKHNNSLGFWFLFRNVEIAEITNFALSVRLIVELVEICHTGWCCCLTENKVKKDCLARLLLH